MNAYKLNEYETWAGNTAEEAIKAAMDQAGVSRDEMVDPTIFDGEPESRDGKVFIDDSMEESTSNGCCGCTLTIGDILDGMLEPGFVCGSE